MARDVGRALKMLYANRIAADYHHAPVERVEEQAPVQLLINQARAALKELGSVHW